MKVKVAVAQYEVPNSHLDALVKLSKVVASASFFNVKILVVPETALGVLRDVKSTEQDYLPDLVNIAKQNNIYIASSFYRKEKNKYFNQGYIVSDEGEVVVRHQKIYLAPPEREEDGISPGNLLDIKRTEYGNLGMLICKDGFNDFSHFLYRKYDKLKADILCIPTWSLTFKELNTQEYIKTLYTYGAFTSRSFVLVSGNLNVSTGSFGRAMIISPIRGVIKEASTNHEELLVEELDLDKVKKARDFHSWWQPDKKVEIK